MRLDLDVNPHCRAGHVAVHLGLRGFGHGDTRLCRLVEVQNANRALMPQQRLGKNAGPADQRPWTHHDNIQDAVIDTGTLDKVDPAWKRAEVGKQNRAHPSALSGRTIQANMHTLPRPGHEPETRLGVGEPAHALLETVARPCNDLGIQTDTAHHQKLFLPRLTFGCVKRRQTHVDCVLAPRERKLNGLFGTIERNT